MPNSLQEAMARIMGAPALQQAPGRSADPWTDWGNSRPISYNQNYTVPGAISGIAGAGTPGTTGVAGQAKSNLPPGMTQADYDAPDFQAAWKAAGGGPVHRTQLGAGPWSAWQAGAPPPTPKAPVSPVKYVEPNRDYYDALMSGKLSTRQGYADFMNKRLAGTGLHAGVNIGGPSSSNPSRLMRPSTGRLMRT